MIPAFPVTIAEAVTVLPAMPKETVGEFEKTTVPLETLLPAAEIASAADTTPVSTKYLPKAL